MNATPCACVVVTDDQNRILVLRRCSKRDIGLWEYPGGKIDPGETSMDGAARELKEEAGLTLKKGELLTFLGAYELENSRGDWTIDVYKAKLSQMEEADAKIMEPDIHDGIEWVTIGKLLTMKLSPDAEIDTEFYTNSLRKN